MLTEQDQALAGDQGSEEEASAAASGQMAGGDREGGIRLALWSRPGYLVRRLQQIHSAIFLEECKEFGVTPVQYGLLTALRHYPGSDQRTLGAELGIDRTNVADVLERLTERGLVRRGRSERDRRSMTAFLTSAGETLLEDSFAHMQRSQERLLAPLAPEFRPAFLAMLVELVEGNNQYSRAELRSDFRVPHKDRVKAGRGSPRALDASSR